MPKCQKIKDDGERCGQNVPEGDEFCLWHDPERKKEADAARQKAAETTARKRRGPGLDLDELPALETPRDAERWLEVVGRAVATNRLTAGRGQAVIRSVREWLRARETGELSDQVAEIREALTAFKKTGDAKHLKRIK